MYKNRSRQMQRGPGRDVSLRFREDIPPPRADQRKYWYGYVHKRSLGSGRTRLIRDPKVPAWLAEEVNSFTIDRWLAYWDPKTGKPLKVVRRRVLWSEAEQPEAEGD